MQQLELQNFRKKFDQIDYQILELLNQRNKLSKKTAELKKQNNLPIQDREREVQIFKDIEQKAEKLQLDKKFINQIFKVIIKNSRNTQNGKH